MSDKQVGIAGNCVLAPKWRLSNDWFMDNVPSLSKKFAKHSGVYERGIFEETESECAKQVLDALFKKFPKLQRQDCCGGIYIAGTGIPQSMLDNVPIKSAVNGSELKENGMEAILQDFVRTNKLTNSFFERISWGCSAFPKALQILIDKIVCRAVSPEQYFLIVTNTKLSQVLDYADASTGGLFGDLCTATLITFPEHPHYPPSHIVLAAKTKTIEIEKEIFGFKSRHNVLVPCKNGGQDYDPTRIVFYMDGTGVAAEAPVTMRNMVIKALSNGIISRADQILPHQASHWVVDWLRIKLEDSGVKTPVINGLITKTGNVSGSSIPSSIDVLSQNGQHLDGITICPTVGIGYPNTPTISAGYIILSSI